MITRYHLPGCAIVALTVSAVAGTVPFDPRGAILFDFEDAAQLRKWQVRELTDLSLTRQWAASGKSSAAITYHKWQEGKERWPAVIALRSQGALRVTDFSLFDALRFEAHNPQDVPVVIKLHLRDSKQKRFSQTIDLPANATKTVSVSVQSIASAVDATDMAELHFYVSEPNRTYTVYVDEIRLTIDALEAAQQLLAKVRGLEAQAVATLRRSEDLASSDIKKQVAEIRTLVGRASNRLVRMRSGKFKTWDAVRNAREELRELQQQCERLAGVLPRLHALERARRVGADEFVLATESSMKKVFLEASRSESKFASECRLALARNEHESFQVIVHPFEGAIRDVKWTLSPITGPKGARLPASVRLVGHVDCKQPSYKVSHTGWWPDPLIDFMQGVAEVPLGEVLPLWMTVEAREDTPAGTYRGKVTVSARDAKPQSVDLEVEVWDFAIPKHTHLRTALSWRGLSTKLYPAEKTAEMTRKYENWMVEEYHLNPNNIYSGPPSWDAERLRELVSTGLNAINLGYFNAPREPDFNAEAYWKSFDDKVKRIQAYLPIVEAAGARDLCFIYCFDERPSNQLDVVFETAGRLKKLWPDIEVMTTAYDSTFGLGRKNGGAMDIWVPLTPHFDGNADRLAEARKAGRDLWWYICIGPQNPYANWFVEYTAIEPRLIMGAMTAKYRPGGFLYYAVNRWPLNDRVITSGPRTDWNPASYKNNNGDGSILCAGPEGPLATIRLENIRDGIEDYEYYLLVRDLLKKKGADQSVGEVAKRAVENLTTFTRAPEVLRAERRRVAKAILALSK